MATSDTDRQQENTLHNRREKTLDITRSILISDFSARRRRRSIHHGERAAVRDALRCVVLGHDGDHVDELTSRLHGTLHVAGRKRNKRISDMVEGRRGGDKTAPLERWALHRVLQRPEADAVSLRASFRSKLPSNLIGRHALSHLDSVIDHKADRAWRAAFFADEPVGADPLIERALVTIVESGLHSQLNWYARLRFDGLHHIEEWASSPYFEDKIVAIHLGLPFGDYEARVALDRYTKKLRWRERMRPTETDRWLAAWAGRADVARRKLIVRELTHWTT